MSESEFHKDIKEIIAGALNQGGYKAELEIRDPKTNQKYDVVASREGVSFAIAVKNISLKPLPPPELRPPIKPNIKCPHCGYEWRTYSRLVRVSCPSCRRAVKIAVQGKRRRG